MSFASESLFALDKAVRRERLAWNRLLDVVGAEHQGNPRLIQAMSDLADSLRESADRFARDWAQIEKRHPA